MPIAIRCACGKTLAAPDQYAGRRVKCPACGKTLTVASKAAAEPREKGDGAKPKRSQPDPEHAGIGSLLDEVDLAQSKTGHRCPECRADLHADDVLCVECGYNTETGRKLKTKKIENVRRVGHAVIPPADKSKETAPPGVQSLVKLLNMVGGVAFLVGLLTVVWLAFQAYQKNPDLQSGVLTNTLLNPGLPILGGALLLWTVPSAVAANLLQQGKPAGRIMTIVVGVLALPLLALGALVLKGALSDEVTRYCR
jgi:hypothetical protein